jgi:hypothetical protein
MIPLPAYVDQEAWQGLMEVRAKLKAPNTAYAQKLLLYEVQRIKDAGHDANEAIKQSVLKGWKDVYCPKDKPIEPAKRQEAEQTQAWIAEHRREPTGKPEGWAQSVKQKLRSVG